MYTAFALEINYSWVSSEIYNEFILNFPLKWPLKLIVNSMQFHKDFDFYFYSKLFCKELIDKIDLLKIHSIFLLFV